MGENQYNYSLVGGPLDGAEDIMTMQDGYGMYDNITLSHPMIDTLMLHYSFYWLDKDTGDICYKFVREVDHSNLEEYMKHYVSFTEDWDEE